MPNINLGAGNEIKDGYINHDLRRHRHEIVLTFDLNCKDWTEYVNEQSIDRIRAWDVIEHIDDVVNFIDNCWNLLKTDGVLHIKACGWKNPNYHIDPTHKRAFDVNSLDYFDPSTKLGSEYNFYSERKWKILDKRWGDKDVNVYIKLTPRK